VQVRGIFRGAILRIFVNIFWFCCEYCAACLRRQFTKCTAHTTYLKRLLSSTFHALLIHIYMLFLAPKLFYITFLHPQYTIIIQMYFNQQTSFVHTDLLYVAALRLNSKQINKIQHQIKGYIHDVAQCDRI